MTKFLHLGIFIIVFLLIPSHLRSQHHISGRVIENDGKETPLGFASIVLTTIDSVYNTGMTSDVEGKFNIRNVKTGDYILSVSFIGYSPVSIALNNLSSSVDLGSIYLNAGEQIDAIEVRGSNVTTRTDRSVIFVTDHQKEISTNGVNLLNTMQLPRLTVNPITNEVSLPGDGNILFCINGVNASTSDIIALQPNEIIRVEYIDNPGLRYGEADLVINYILKRAVAGGSISGDVSSAVTTKMVDGQISGKFNYKRSEFGFNYSLRYRKPTEIMADETRVFNFSDGSSLFRIENGLPSDWQERYHNLAFNYNLLDEKYFFNVTVRHSILDDDKIRNTDQHSSSTPQDITNIRHGSATKQKLPSIDLYYSRNLGNKQTLIFNVVGTYINSRLNQIYQERENEKLRAEIISDVDGRKYSLIGEGIYEKAFSNGNRLSLGLKHNQGFADNEYSGNVKSKTKMDQAESYVYAEYSGKKNKLSYITGVGVSRSWAKQKGVEDYSFYTFRPKLTLQYDLARSTFIRLKGEIYNSSPSLSNLSDVEQNIDTLQVRRGNPLLEPNLNYRTEMHIGWKNAVYGANLYLSYTYRPDPIMEETFIENGKFIQTFDNQKNWQKFNSEISLSAKPVKNVLMLGFSAGVNHYKSNGNNYNHSYTNFYYSAEVMASYKKFMAMFQINSSYDTFVGETLNGGEHVHLFMLAYNHGRFSVGAGMIQPFSKNYERYTENRNAYMSYKNHSYVNDLSRMLQLKFSWNFNYGRKAEGRSKRLHNSDNDSGIMQTR